MNPKRRLRRRLSRLAVILAAVMTVNLAAPEVLLDLVPPCPLKAMSGYECPACGAGRAISALGRGDLAAAWRLNFLAVLGVAMVPVFAVAEYRRRHSGQRQVSRPLLPAVAVGLAAASVLYGIARNVDPSVLNRWLQ